MVIGTYYYYNLRYNGLRNLLKIIYIFHGIIRVIFFKFTELLQILNSEYCILRYCQNLNSGFALLIATQKPTQNNHLQPIRFLLPMPSRIAYSITCRPYRVTKNKDTLFTLNKTKTVLRIN